VEFDARGLFAQDGEIDHSWYGGGKELSHALRQSGRG
jgi:hypothetical protein